jgi:hypothetical protein
MGGVVPPVERFDAAGRSRFGVRRMWSSHHFDQIYEFTT